MRNQRAEGRGQTADDCDAPFALCGRPGPDGGFTLMEVMIAMFVFFIVVFAILGMVVQSMGAARALQRPQPDFSILASAITLSNTLEEGVESGDFNETYPGIYQGCTWMREITEASSNGLFQVDFYEFAPSGKKSA